MKSTTRAVAASLLLLLIFNTAAASEELKFEANTKLTGFVSGAYDAAAIQPIDNNWSRISRFSGIDKPQFLGTTEYDGYCSGMAIGKNNVVYVTQAYNDYTNDKTEYHFTLTAIDKSNKVLWTFDKKSAGQCDPGNPVIGSDGTIYVSVPNFKTDTIIYAIDPNGKEKWSHMPGKKGAFDFGIFRSDLFLDSKGMLYTGGSYLTANELSTLQGFVYQISPNGTGKIIKTIKRMIVDKVVAGGDGALYVTGYVSVQGRNRDTGRICALDAKGNERWQYTLNLGCNFTTDLLIGSDNTVYFGSRDGILHAVGSNGKAKWKYNAGDILFSTPIMDNNGMIFFGAGDDRAGKYYSKYNGHQSELDKQNLGMLVALNKDGKKAWSRPLKHGTSTSPIMDNSGRLYLVDNIGTFLSYDTKGNLLWSMNSEKEQEGRFSSVYLNSEKMLYFRSEDALTEIGNKEDQ